MTELTDDECRVLGVLVEKAHTTATQYPLSLNALTTGCNQKSNRHPVVHLDEDRVVRALDGLRGKQLAVFVDMAGSRVMKYKHTAREGLDVDTRELVILTELLLRGPQTSGEIRARASRMYQHLGSLDDVRHILENLMARDEPMVRRLAPAPGSRAERYAQLLCADLHPLDESAGGADAPEAPAPVAPADPPLAGRVEQLEHEVDRLRRIVEALAESLGATDLLADDDAPQKPEPPADPLGEPLM